ncbi:hypothetical protein TrVE_jg10691 [Triparma verrucosa]|uniref:Uncharacterized protein n=1 Tax=Triparma verrucosa TaxID=1606542 RepID=A0A9W7EMX9_9STRA|nr:hypothetical protein TrVE_jg10691 [Triparma verrucosa]
MDSYEANQSVIHEQVYPDAASTPHISICAMNHFVVTEKLGVPYDSCTSDCVGSTVTDVGIAVHAAYMAYRIFRQRPKFDGVSFVIASYVLVNSIWSFEGSLFWLQPKGRRLPNPFDVKNFNLMWKLNAQFEAVLLFLFWKLAFSLLEASGTLHPFFARHKKTFMLLFFLHGLSFSLITMYDCDFENYVLYGASNIVLPLTSAWVSLIVITYTYWPHLTREAERTIKAYRPAGSARLFNTHPLILGVLSGSAYWVGNTGIYFGKDVLLTLWTRNALSFFIGRAVSSNEWEEMALFHLGTLVGNEMLFRCWVWVAAAEAQAKQSEGKSERDNKNEPRAWLKEVLLQEKLGMKQVATPRTKKNN